MVRGVAIVAAGTGVHRGDQHERTGVFHAVLGAADADRAVVQRLAQHLQHATAQLGHLDQEEHTIMGETDFTRLGIVATTDEGDLRDGMMG